MGWECIGYFSDFWGAFVAVLEFIFGYFGINFSPWMLMGPNNFFVLEFLQIATMYRILCCSIGWQVMICIVLYFILCSSLLFWLKQEIQGLFENRNYGCFIWTFSYGVKICLCWYIYMDPAGCSLILLIWLAFCVGIWNYGLHLDIDRFFFLSI